MLRPLLRITLFALLLLCLLGWTLSYFQTLYLQYGTSRPTAQTRPYIAPGACVVLLDGGLYLGFGTVGPTDWSLEPKFARPDPAPFYLLSFNAGYLRGIYFLRIPFWFLTALTLLLLYLLRSRKRQPAFPVEAATPVAPT